MAGASDPLEDMLFTEVDEKAVSDLVGSLESQLGDGTNKREAAPPAAGTLSGKEPSSTEQQQGRPRTALTPEPGSGRASSSSSPALLPGGTAPSVGSPGPGPVTPSAQTSAAGFQRASAPGDSTVPPEPRTSSPGVQSVNGVKATGTGSSGAASPAAGSHTGALQKPPVAQNGLDQKGGLLVAPGGPTAPVQNHGGTLIHTKMLLPGQSAPGTSVVLANTPPPATVPSPVSQTGTGTSPAASVTLTAGVKPAINGVAVVRPPSAPVVGTSIQHQRPGMVAGTPTRAATPQPTIAVRPQQQTTIQLQPGFTMPPGMVLIRTETGQLVMVPQQVLAQAQAKTQTQTVTNITQRPAATPTAGTTIRVSAATTAPGPPQTVRLTSPTQSRIVQPAVTTVQKALTVPPGGGVPVKMATPHKAPTVITAGSAKPPGTPTPVPSPAAPRVSVLSQEMQENVKKCKNFLATLIKLASHNPPCPDTSKNVKGLVQDLLDAKIEPEEFTTRLQAELKSSPQPYLIPFLKKSLPALRQSLLNSQQSLMTAPAPSSSAPQPVTPTSGASVRPRVNMETGGSVRLNTPISNASTVTVSRASVQTVQTRSPVVISQTFRPQGTLIRGPAAIIAGKTPINLAAQANQKKLSDPGGGTFRDDDDINDVASMAGVNLNEENARILATSSELVGTKIRSCKDESFLPTGLLHRRILETAKKLGVGEVPLDVVNLVSHATQSRLRSLLEKVSAVAQHRADGGKDEEYYEQTSDVRSQLRFFEQLERLEKQRKDEQEREILLKAAKSRARQEDPEQARLKQKAKEMQQQELAQMRQRDANLTALAAIGPRKKRKLDSPGGTTASSEVSCGLGPSSCPPSSGTSSRQQLRHRITRVNLRDFIFCLEQERSTARSLTLYKALLK